MPGMNGRELAAKLAEAYPSMRCLFMSGYTANVIAHRGILEENVHFLCKPFNRDELARKVREVLDEYGCWDWGMLGLGDAGIEGCWDAGIGGLLGCWDWGMLGFWDAGIEGLGMMGLGDG